MIRLQQLTPALLLVFAALAMAEVVPTPSPEPVRATTSVAVSYVLVPFVVTDLKGLPVRNLREQDVTLLVDGTRVQTDLFARSDDAPVSFTILLDGSGSMDLAGKLAGARAAVSALVEQKIPGDDFALFVFAEGEVREVVSFTEDTARVVAAVNAVKPFGRTAFFDALAKMPDKSLLGKTGSRAPRSGSIRRGTPHPGNPRARGAPHGRPPLDRGRGLPSAGFHPARREGPSRPVSSWIHGRGHGARALPPHRSPALRSAPGDPRPGWLQGFGSARKRLTNNRRTST